MGEVPEMLDLFSVEQGSILKAPEPCSDKPREALNSCHTRNPPSPCDCVGFGEHSVYGNASTTSFFSSMPT